MNDTPKPRRRWLRYSLITLLVLALLAGGGMHWVARRLQRSMKQNEAIEAITKSGGKLRCDFELDASGNRLPEASRPGSAWLRSWIGDDLGAHVIEVDAQADSALKNIKNLPQLRRLHLASEWITDVGLEYLEPMQQLETLSLEKTQVTEQGVHRLQKALPNCRIIH